MAKGNRGTSPFRADSFEPVFVERVAEHSFPSVYVRHIFEQIPRLTIELGI